MPSKIAEAIGKMPMDPLKEPEEDEDSYSSIVSPEEIDAMKVFEKAKGPEAKAKALKLFLEACGLA